TIRSGRRQPNSLQVRLVQAAEIAFWISLSIPINFVMAARAEKHKIGWVVGERRSLGFVMVRSTPWALWASWQDVGYLAPFHGLTCTVVIHEVGTAQLTMACSLSPHDTLRHVVSVIAAGGSIGFFLFSHEAS
ncbi:hypothetical protein ABW53_10410, partial [Stutzerimonas stutzeri]